MDKPRVIGRFAPTPSGPLHFGSLVTAVASYCEARSQKGQWLLRIEDVDTPRNVAGSSKDIITTLEAFGFEWDGDIEYQSNQFDHYQSILDDLFEKGHSYACECSRRSLREANAQSGSLGIIYPGLCQKRGLKKDNHSIRVNTGISGIKNYIDQVYGLVKFDVKQQLGDFVLRRADGIYAYHLVVVIDDERQSVNQIVRGADLLEATCLHLFLQALLDYQTPQYLHVPLVRNHAGDKLSKQTGATAIRAENKIPLLINALEILGQEIDPHMRQASAEEILSGAIRCWRRDKIDIPPGDID